MRLNERERNRIRAHAMALVTFPELEAREAQAFKKLHTEVMRQINAIPAGDMEDLRKYSLTRETKVIKLEVPWRTENYSRPAFEFCLCPRDFSIVVMNRYNGCHRHPNAVDGESVEIPLNGNFIVVSKEMSGYVQEYGDACVAHDKERSQADSDLWVLLSGAKSVSALRAKWPGVDAVMEKMGTGPIAKAEQDEDREARIQDLTLRPPKG